jgi:hypothetical protein
MLIDHDHLIGQVQHRARLTSRGGAEGRRSPSGQLSKRLRSASARAPIKTSELYYRRALAITKTAPTSIGGDLASASA